MGFSKSLRVPANLLVDPDHDLVHADTINLRISIPRIVRRATRNIKHAARALKEVIVNEPPVQRANVCSYTGSIHNSLDLSRAAPVLPDIPTATPELFGKDNYFHWLPLRTRKTMISPRRSSKDAQCADLWPSRLLGRYRAQASTARLVVIRNKCPGKIPRTVCNTKCGDSMVRKG